MVRAADDFAHRYGRWAVVAGASEGLGAAFARSLAARGMNVLLVARRSELLQSLSDELKREHGVEVRTLVQDLADPRVAVALQAATRSLEVGVGVYNAAYAPGGEFLNLGHADLLRVVDVNVRAPLLFSHTLLEGMRARRRGALVLMASLAGLQGTPRLAAYAASKAFNVVLAESLWAELNSCGVDVVCSCAGAIRTPGYRQRAKREAPGTLDAFRVAERTLAALGRGPRVIPGATNQFAAWLMNRLLTRKTAVRLMGANTKDLT